MEIREIKFRVWDTINGMFRHQHMNYEPTLSNADFRKHKIVLLNNIFKDEEYVWMQYTGITDCVGTEIYEKDVVLKEFDNGFEYGSMYGVVEFVNGCWMIKNKFGHHELLYSEVEEIKVLGNIYDDPQLLD